MAAVKLTLYTIKQLNSKLSKLLILLDNNLVKKAEKYIHINMLYLDLL